MQFPLYFIMKKVLEEIADIINQYNKMIEIDGTELNYLIKQLTTRLYYLETQRSEYHKQYQSIIFNLTQDGKTVSRAENEAHDKIPEIYMLRRIMNAGYRVVDAMRTNISYLKFEITNTKNG